MHRYKMVLSLPARGVRVEIELLSAIIQKYPVTPREGSAG